MKKMKWWTIVPLSFALLTGCQQSETKESASTAPKEEKKVAEQTETPLKKTELAPKENDKTQTETDKQEEVDVSKVDKDTPPPSANQYQSNDAVISIENGAYGTMALYLDGIANAITEHDYSQVMPYITPNTPIADSTQMMMSDLNSKHISEEFITFDLISLKKTGTSPEGDDYTIQTHEVFLLTDEDTGKKTLKEYDCIYSATLLPSNFFRLNVVDEAPNPVGKTFSDEERKKIEQSGWIEDEEVAGTADTTDTAGSTDATDATEAAAMNLVEFNGFWSDVEAQTPVQLEFKMESDNQAQVKVNYGTESSTDWQLVTFDNEFGYINYLNDGTGTSGNIEIMLGYDASIMVTIEPSNEDNPSSLPSGAYILTKQ